MYFASGLVVVFSLYGLNRGSDSNGQEFLLPVLVIFFLACGMVVWIVRSILNKKKWARIVAAVIFFSVAALFARNIFYNQNNAFEIICSVAAIASVAASLIFLFRRDSNLWFLE
jgi:peptidoglycan/LPS O-acetylase OafA/YrhL